MTEVSYNNFSYGQGDSDLSGRYDIPIYTKTMKQVLNFFTNYKGTAKLRTGTKNRFKFQDCAIYDFIFNEEQSYLLVFYEYKLRFLTYDASGELGWVLSGGSPLELTTPYTLEESKSLQKAQTQDVVYFTNTNHEPMKLLRTGASTFTFSTYTRTNDPFTGATKYPRAVCFYGARLFFGGTEEKPTTIWGSKAADYDYFAPTTPPSTIVEEDPITLTPAILQDRILWLTAGENSLIAGSHSALVGINGGEVGAVITAKNADTTSTSVQGCSNVIPVHKDSMIFYSSNTNRNINYFNYSLLTEAFDAPSANMFSYEITNSGIKKMVWKKDKEDLVYNLLNNGEIATLNFSKSENIVGWHQYETDGLIEDIALITNNDGVNRLFELVLRDGDYYIETISDEVEFVKREDFLTDDEQADCVAYRRKVSEQLRECVYLDNSVVYNDIRTVGITFDGVSRITAASATFAGSDVGHHIEYKVDTGYDYGRFEIIQYISPTIVDVAILITPSSNTCSEWYMTFSQVSGLTDYTGRTVSLVTDGGYYKDEYVPAGDVYFDSEVSSVVIGSKYKGIIKSFPLGFQYKGKNTQISKKNVSSIYLRLVNSAGGLAGTDIYKTESVQMLENGSLNYAPPMLMSGTKEVTIASNSSRDLSFIIAQDKPLPLTITNVVINGSFS